MNCCICEAEMIQPSKDFCWACRECPKCGAWFCNANNRYDSTFVDLIDGEKPWQFKKGEGVIWMEKEEFIRQTKLRSFE